MLINFDYFKTDSFSCIIYLIRHCLFSDHTSFCFFVVLVFFGHFHVFNVVFCVLVAVCLYFSFLVLTFSVYFRLVILNMFNTFDCFALVMVFFFFSLSLLLCINQNKCHGKRITKCLYVTAVNILIESLQYHLIRLCLLKSLR